MPWWRDLQRLHHGRATNTGQSGSSTLCNFRFFHQPVPPCRPSLSSLIPHPSSLIPHPSSLISQLSSLNSHLSTLISQLSSLNSHLSTLISQLSTLISARHRSAA